MTDYALQFDGSQNYVSFGTMGSFGSNLGNGFYCSFQIQSVQTTQGQMGVLWGSAQVLLQFNLTGSSSQVSGALALSIQDPAGDILQGGANSPTINFNDGKVHTVVFTANITAKTIAISIDGVSQTITYFAQQTLSSFTNFTSNFDIGQRSDTGGGKLACVMDNFQIGTSATTLYGSYKFNEGTGTTTADVSGNGNTGTLNGSPLPYWVGGLSYIPTGVDQLGYFTQDPGVYRASYMGTAPLGSLISPYPTFLSHLQILQRAASGTITVSNGLNAISPQGTYALGTQTQGDLPQVIPIKQNFPKGLFITNSAGVALEVAYLP